MASVASPYGFRPVSLIGGQVYAGSTRLMKMTNSYGTSLFFGDVVKIVAGTIEKDTGTATATPVGIFLGCTYTDPTMKYKLFSQNWVASTVATDNYAYVCDDPDALFQVQSSGSLAQTAVGKNAAIVQNAGSTVFGVSRVAIGAAATTNTLPVRIIGFVDGPDSAVGDAFTDVLVKWNFGMHQYETALGV